MRVLFDNDVMLDLVLDREPFVEAAAAVFQYRNTTLPVFTPADFLNHLKQQPS